MSMDKVIPLSFHQFKVVKRVSSEIFKVPKKNARVYKYPEDDFQIETLKTFSFIAGLLVAGHTVAIGLQLGKPKIQMRVMIVYRDGKCIYQTIHEGKIGALTTVSLKLDLALRALLEEWESIFPQVRVQIQGLIVSHPDQREVIRWIQGQPAN